MGNIILNLKRAARLVRVINYNKAAKFGPLCLDVAVTSRCNHRCIFCSAHSALKPVNTAPEEISAEVLERLLQDCVRLGVREIVFAGDGEPMLYKGLPDIISRYGAKLDIRLLTNGSTLDLLTPQVFARLGKLTISMNSIDPQTHRTVHGYAGQSQLPRITENIERLLKLPHAKDKLQINYVICRENYAEFDALLALAKKWGIYFAIRPVAPVFEELAPSVLGLEDIAALKKRIAAHSQSASGNFARTLAQVDNACDIGHNRVAAAACVRPCYFGFYWGNIWSNGDYSHCTYGTGCKLGNIAQKRFSEIWSQPATQLSMYRAALMAQTGDNPYAQCVGCMGPQLQSASFHRIFKKIPLQLKVLQKRLSMWQENCG